MDGSVSLKKENCGQIAPGSRHRRWGGAGPAQPHETPGLAPSMAMKWVGKGALPILRDFPFGLEGLGWKKQHQHHQLGAPWLHHHPGCRMQPLGPLLLSQVLLWPCCSTQWLCPSCLPKPLTLAFNYSGRPLEI